MMTFVAHTARQFADALKRLMPPGAAWDWPQGGLGDQLLLGLGAALARVEQEIQAITDYAIQVHTPGQAGWHINNYRAVAAQVVQGVIEPPRLPSLAGRLRAGQRLWSINAASTTFTVPLLQVDHLTGPMIAGNAQAGDTVLSGRGRYILRVRYYDSVVSANALASALMAYKQAHVFLWLQDITGRSGDHLYA